MVTVEAAAVLWRVVGDTLVVSIRLTLDNIVTTALLRWPGAGGFIMTRILVDF